MSFDTGQFTKKCTTHVKENANKYTLSGSGILSAIVALGVAYLGAHKTDVELHEKVQKLRDDVDFLDKWQPAVEDDYNGQIKELKTKFWTTNRIFRTDISELQRKVNQ